VGGDAAQRVGFAAPLKVVQKILPMLQREGRVVRAWVGIYTDRVTPEAADRAGLKKPLGALVNSVVPRGPAERAGLRAGDVIVSFDNRDVLSATELPWLASLVGVGRSVPVKVWRDGKPQSFTLLTERMPE
jgi:serine protease Do